VAHSTGLVTTFRAKLIVAFLVSMLIPTLAAVLIFQDVARRSELAERFYTLRDLGVVLGRAAQSVGEFGNLAQRDIDFFESGDHETIGRWNAATAAARDTLRALLLESSASNRPTLESMQRELIVYAQLLDELPPVLRQRGIQDFGVAGEMRDAIHRLEERLQRPDYRVHLLMLRRHEKDYIIRDLDRYLDDHRARAEAFRRDLIACDDCSPGETQERLLLLDTYINAFDRLVELDRRVGVRGGTGLYARIQQVEAKLFEDHRALMERVSAETEAMVSQARERIAATVVAVTVLALLFSGLLSRRLTRPLATLSERIRHYVDSRFSAQVDTDDFGDSASEVRHIAHDFGAMQSAIRHHLADLHEQQRALVSLNAELDSQRSNLSTAQRMAGLGYWRCDTRSGTFTASPELLHMLGYEADHEFSCAGFIETVIHADSREEFSRDIALCEHTGRPVERVYRAVSATSGDLWIRQFIRAEADTAPGSSSLVGAVQDVSRQRQSEEAIRHLAYFDSLTGLSQRSYLFQRLEDMVRSARRRSERFALFFIDLDKFKEINDSLGHEAGDRMLVTVADRLRGAARDSDFVARLGGDEFCMLLDNVPSDIDVADIALRLLERLSLPVEIGGRTFTPLASMGISLFPEDGEDTESLMTAADNAMYAAKRRGDHSYVFHEHEISAEANERLRMSREIRQAMRENEFAIFYQPQVAAASGQVEGWEALLRWHHPDRGLLSAASFIDDLERIGLVSDLGRWVVDTVCRQIAQWRSDGLAGTRISVNIAPRHMAEGTVAAEIAAAMDRHGVKASQLEVEITEAGIQSGEDIRAATEAVRALGVRIAIDDFGTGYSSLASLRSLTVDSLKIDRTFVQFAATSTTDRRLLSSIIELGSAFGYRLVAEGVEDPEQLTLLESMGCHLVQGYLFSPAVEAEAVPALLRSGFDVAQPPRSAAGS